MAENTKYGKEMISWDFPEFIPHERTRGWYVAVIIIAALLLLYAIITANFLFAIIVIIVAVIMFFKTSNTAMNVIFSIYEDGVRVGDKFYDFKEIKDFYIIYEPPEAKNIYFNFNSLLQPRLQIPLLEQDPVKVREILRDYIEEDLDRSDEPFSDGIGRIFKI
ncbi:MAG: hypothetical protein WC310_00835 [Patescibacteria group bacterium]|jgi:hypothetical protein